jgi:predicted O-linked N-acetylglucosamine transferase (SPINDLY family)
VNDLDHAKQLFFEALALFDAGDFGNAERQFLAAHRLAPDNLSVLTNLALVLRKQDKFAAAREWATRIISLRPGDVEILHVLAECDVHERRVTEAGTIYAEIITRAPTNAKAHNNYGLLLYNSGAAADALDCYRRAIELEPGNAATYVNLGNALRHLNRLDEADGAFEKAITLEAPLAEAWLGQGNVLFQRRRHHDALANYDNAIALKPGLANAWLGRGNALAELNRFDEAFSAYDGAIERDPTNAEAWIGRANIFTELKRYDDALGAYDKARALAPGLAETWVGLGNVLTDLERYDEATDAFDKALELNPRLASGWVGRGYLYDRLKKNDQAAGAYRMALDIEPHFPFLPGMLLFQKMLCCDWQGGDVLIAKIANDIERGQLSVDPFSWLSVATSPRSLQRCAELYSATRFSAHRESTIPRGGSRQKLRIGYVAGEFRQHATALLLAGTLEHHDRGRFEIFAFDNGADDGSEARRRIQTAVHSVVGIRNLGDAQAVAAIRDSEIDVLVNLNGYVGAERTRIFAGRAAPVQVNYLGFPGTMGAEFMDYIIADRHVLPEEHLPFYTEKVVWLPHCYQANDRTRKISEIEFSRVELGLPPDAFVFCCFNNNYKIMPAVFDAWMQILRQVKGSVLWLLEDNPTAAKNLRKEAAARGIDPSRMIFAGRMGLSEHLARHRCADLFLDTSPCNAHTTASDALWAGLPVLTYQGDTFAGRVASSLLCNLDLPELVTKTSDAYIRLAAEIAENPENLAVLKRKLTKNRMTSPLFDTASFTAHLERAYEMMIARRRTGLQPEHFAAPD